MEISTSEVFMRMSFMEKANILMEMEIVSKVDGKMEKDMELANFKVTMVG